MSAVADWTMDRGGIAYQHCTSCGCTQYFRRAFCAACGAISLEVKQSSGQGVVYAVTIVHRAPTDALRKHVPYAILLVDMAEGFRVMAHGDTTLRIGDAVTARFHEFIGTRVPYFEKDQN